MTLIWLFFWAIMGTHPVVFEDMATAPPLNGWAIALSICVALDIGISAGT